MEKDSQKASGSDADQPNMLKKIAALQKKVRKLGLDKPMTTAESKAFMDDQWGEGDGQD